MPAMIDYAVLCQAIEEWKSGTPAAAATPPRPKFPARQAAPVEDEVVEYSGSYDTADAPAEPQESTVIYQLPDYENVEVNDDE